MTVPIMSLDCLKCHVEYVIFYYGGKFLDVVREHFISSKMQVIVGSCRLLWWVHTFSPLTKSTVSKILIVTLSDIAMITLSNVSSCSNFL